MTEKFYIISDTYSEVDGPFSSLTEAMKQPGDNYRGAVYITKVVARLWSETKTTYEWRDAEKS